jgi:hypothetical protein
VAAHRARRLAARVALLAGGLGLARAAWIGYALWTSWRAVQRYAGELELHGWPGDLDPPTPPREIPQGDDRPYLWLGTPARGPEPVRVAEPLPDDWTGWIHRPHPRPGDQPD